MDFKKQIEEDIKDYQKQFPHIIEMEKPEWAFNYWILDKLYKFDDGDIISRIIDYDDRGIDCFVWDEESKDLILIQNKYYTDGKSKLDLDYYTSNFLSTPTAILENGTYKRSEKLQKIFSDNKDDEKFTVYLYLYITLNPKDKTKYVNATKKFNTENAKKRYIAHIFWLDDIAEKYYNEPIVEETKTLKFQIQSNFEGTMITIDNDTYGLNQSLKSIYVVTPVLNLYKLVTTSKQKKYPLFSSNIRDYLGMVGANKGIRDTLASPDQRRNFFYYNNGITIIVDKIGEETYNNGSCVEIINPQIVNGCQTVSTIFDVLDGWDSEKVEDDFKNVFVMSKILEIPKDDQIYSKLIDNIVKYNNSQNGISLKAHNIKEKEAFYKRQQEEFKSKGFLLCVRQSDKNKFTTDYKEVVEKELLSKNHDLLKQFGINASKKIKDYLVELDKLYQIYIAFYNPAEAIQQKSKLLLTNTDPAKPTLNDKIVKFIDDTTFKQRLDLLLLYKRIVQEVADKDLSNKVNPFMFIYCFGHYECKGDPSNIVKSLSSKESIDEVIRTYIACLKTYYSKWTKHNPDKAYNDMSKSQFDSEIFEDILETFEGLES